MTEFRRNSTKNAGYLDTLAHFHIFLTFAEIMGCRNMWKEDEDAEYHWGSTLTTLSCGQKVTITLRSGCRRPQSLEVNRQLNDVGQRPNMIIRKEDNPKFAVPMVLFPVESV